MYLASQFKTVTFEAISSQTYSNHDVLNPPGPDPSHVVEFRPYPLVVTRGWWVQLYNRSYSTQFGFLTGSAHFGFLAFLTMQYFYNGPIMYFMDNGKEDCPDFGPFIILTNVILNN
jgi:hypothetical protein